MTGAEIALLISSISAGAAQGAQASQIPDSTKMGSFLDIRGPDDDNYYYSDPRGLLQKGSRGAAQMAMGLADVAKQPITMRSSFAQALPTFTGGGLPMPIGVRAHDPALNTPGLLTGPGTDVTRSPDIELGGDPSLPVESRKRGASADLFPGIPSGDNPLADLYGREGDFGDTGEQALASLDLLGLGDQSNLNLKGRHGGKV